MSNVNHLKLVVSNPQKQNFFGKFLDWLNKPRDIEIKIPFVKTKNEKLSAIKNFYLKKYRLEDITDPETINIPYFLRVDNKIAEIIKNNAINKEYKKIRGRL